jgi:hypothetical protein
MKAIDKKGDVSCIQTTMYLGCSGQRSKTTKRHWGMIKTDQIKKVTFNISAFITLQAFYSIKPIEENNIKY